MLLVFTSRGDEHSARSIQHRANRFSPLEPNLREGPAGAGSRPQGVAPVLPPRRTGSSLFSSDRHRWESSGSPLNGVAETPSRARQLAGRCPHPASHRICHQPRCPEKERAASQNGQKGFAYSVPGHLARVRGDADKFSPGAMIQTRRAVPPRPSNVESESR